MKNTAYIQEVTERESELLKAIKKSDVLQLDKMLHEDLLFTNPMGQTITKEIDLQTYRSGAMKVNSIGAEDMQMNIIEDTAIVAVTIKLSGSYQTYSLDGMYRYTRVWKRLNDLWQVIAGSCVLLNTDQDKQGI